jgi:hypothetical protein
LAKQPTCAGVALARRLGESVRRRLLYIVVCASPLAAGGLMVGTVAAGATTARAARTLTLSETGHLRLTSKHAFTLNEQGSASGTITGTIYIHLHIANNQGDVTAEVNIYPHGGSLSGYGSASYEVEGADATFTGKLAITRGTGSFAGAHASSLQFSGDIARRTDAVAVKLSGQLSV